jgi:hypothetical protein
MTISTHGKTLDQTIAAIQALDLSPIKFKTTCKEDGYGWSADHADTMEVAYKRYLILQAKYPEMTLAPDREIDRFWHMHILDTRKYAADCEASFGHFLHHFPYLGLRGEEDAKLLQTAFAKMQALYAQEFGEPMPALQRDASTASIRGGQAVAAFCSDKVAQAKAAFCSDKMAQAKAAFCSDKMAQAKAAFCSDKVAQAEAAFCSDKVVQAEAAFCSDKVGQAEAAFCSVEPGSRAGADSEVEPVRMI